MRGFGTIYKRLNSRFLWIQFWHKGKCKQESSGSEKLRDAQDLLKRRFAEAQTQLPAAAHSLTVGNLFEQMERDYKINGHKSLRNIQSAWKNHLAPVFGSLPAQLVTPQEITLYISDRQKQGASNATINLEMAQLRRMYVLALRTQQIASKPYIPRLNVQNVRRGFVKDAQYDALARETGIIGLWLRAMFEVAYSYGWRKSELLNLKVRQVDLIEKTIVLDAGTTKNNEGRIVGMTAKVFELLKECVAGKDSEDFVFTRDHESNGRRTKTLGGHISDFRTAWKVATEAAGCGGLLFHDLRRSAVRNLVRAGVPQKTAQTISGHRTAAIFARYNIIDPSDLHDAVRKLEISATHRNELSEQQEMFPASTPPETSKGKLQ